MRSERGTRLTYEESCRFLQGLGYLDAGAEGVIPPMPDRRPQFDDEGPPGLTFFRTFVGQDIEQGVEDVSDGNLENLTLPRTFFGRSNIQHASFKNTDLSESTLCWNDFTDVFFTDTDLSGCDLRASVYSGVKFVRTNLRNADLRRSSFEMCEFTGADMRGTKLTRQQAEQIDLSDEQQQVIDWQESDGEAPPGG